MLLSAFLEEARLQKQVFKEMFVHNVHCDSFSPFCYSMTDPVQVKTTVAAAISKRTFLSVKRGEVASSFKQVGINPAIVLKSH